MTKMSRKTWPINGYKLQAVRHVTHCKGADQAHVEQRVDVAICVCIATGRRGLISGHEATNRGTKF